MDSKVRGGRVSRCFRNDGLVRRMAEQGATLTEIAKAVGTGKRHVRTYLTRHGIERPPWREAPKGSHPMARATQGHLNPAWKGGRIQDKDGYWLVWMPDHPDANRHGYVREHRYLMEGKLGRPLAKGEVVDHVNGDRGDNRLENLRLFASNGEHLRATLTGVPCPARGNRYGPNGELLRKGGQPSPAPDGQRPS